jgi:hypothetical protein
VTYKLAAVSERSPKAGARGLNLSLSLSLSLSELRSQVTGHASSVMVASECFHLFESCGIRVHIAYLVL